MDFVPPQNSTGRVAILSELTKEERELHINMTADNHNTFLVGTDDPYWIRRLDKIAERTMTSGEWVEYELPANQVTLRKPRKVTEEQRKILSERAKRNFG